VKFFLLFRKTYRRLTFTAQLCCDVESSILRDDLIKITVLNLQQGGVFADSVPQTHLVTEVASLLE
jgi:hypothetical protein